MIFKDQKDYATNDLVRELNEEFGKDKEWPKAIGVTAATFGRICQSVFTYAVQSGVHDTPYLAQDSIIISIHLGKVDYGIMFKYVEFVISK